MSEFITAVATHGFLQQALIAGALASLACGVMGTYVVVKRISYIAGAIAHSVLGGMGAARYLQVAHGMDWLHPLLGAVAAALAAAAVIGLVSLKARQREDTIIGAVWAVGMALGVVCIALTPGYDVQLMSYLFGNILLVTPGDLWLLAGLDLVVLAAAVLLNRQLLAVCLDQEFARMRGLGADAYYLLLLGLTALTVVLLSTMVGIILVIALLTLPAATAANFARRLGPIMLLAGLISLGLTWGGLALSYAPDLPAGAVIILLAGAVYLLVATGNWLKKRA